MATPEELRAKLLAQRAAQQEENLKREEIHAEAKRATRQLITLGYNFDDILELVDVEVSEDHLNGLFRAIGCYRKRKRTEEPALTSFGASRWLDYREEFVLSPSDSSSESDEDPSSEPRDTRPASEISIAADGSKQLDGAPAAASDTTAPITSASPGEGELEIVTSQAPHYPPQPETADNASSLVSGTELLDPGEPPLLDSRSDVVHSSLPPASDAPPESGASSVAASTTEAHEHTFQEPFTVEEGSPLRRSSNSDGLEVQASQSPVSDGPENGPIAGLGSGEEAVEELGASQLSDDYSMSSDYLDADDRDEEHVSHGEHLSADSAADSMTDSSPDSMGSMDDAADEQIPATDEAMDIDSTDSPMDVEPTQVFSINGIHIVRPQEGTAADRTGSDARRGKQRNKADTSDSVQKQLEDVKAKIAEVQQLKLAREARKEADQETARRNMQLRDLASRRSLLAQKAEQIDLKKAAGRVNDLEHSLRLARKQLEDAAALVDSIAKERAELEVKETKLRAELSRPPVISAKQALPESNGSGEALPAAEAPQYPVLTFKDSPLRAFSSFRMCPGLGPTQWFSRTFNSRFVSNLSDRLLCEREWFGKGKLCRKADCEGVHVADFDVDPLVICQYMATRGVEKDGFREELQSALRTHLKGPNVSAAEIAASIIGLCKRRDPTRFLDWQTWGVDSPL